MNLSRTQVMRTKPDGLWMTFDADDGPELIRVDVPGNEALMAALSPGGQNRPLTREEIDRAVAWTYAHPEQQQLAEDDAHAEAEDDMRRQAVDAERDASFGHRVNLGETPGQMPMYLYIDSRYGTMTVAPAAPDVRWWVRVVPTTHHGVRAIESGEFPLVVSPEQIATILEAKSDAERAQMVTEAGSEHDEEASPAYQSMLRNLQETIRRQPHLWPDVPRSIFQRPDTAPLPKGFDPHAAPRLGPRSDAAPTGALPDLAAAFRPAAPSLGTPPQRVAGNLTDTDPNLRWRHDAHVPSVREQDAPLPSWLQRPPTVYPMPQIVPWESGPTTPPYMPGIMPSPSDQPSIGERASLGGVETPVDLAAAIRSMARAV